MNRKGIRFRFVLAPMLNMCIYMHLDDRSLF
jgi:hypothetical protein